MTLLLLWLLSSDIVVDARNLAVAGDCRGALALLAPHLETPAPIEAFGLAGECHISLGDAAGAATAFDAGLRRYPASLPLLKAYAGMLIRWKPKDAASAKTLERLRLLGSRDAEANYLYGQWALLVNREPAAIAALRRTIGLAPRNDAARMQNWTLIAVAEEQQNHPEAAEEAYRQALAANRRLPALDCRAAQRYVDYLDQNGQQETAGRLAEELLQAQPTWAPALFLRAKTLGRPRLNAAAAAAAEIALTHLEGDVTLERAIRAFLIRTYFTIGQKDRAQEHQRWIDSH